MKNMKALILVDLQNDFVAPGALPVPGGEEVVPLANQLAKTFPLVVATQDWHPANHQSFASQHPGMKVGETFELNGLPQVAWPDHCIQNTTGADFLPRLNTESIDRVFKKGLDPLIDSYSGFFDNGHRHATGLGEYLKVQQVTEVVVMGLATDYCVRFTALDAVSLGFKTSLILDGCRGVDLKSGDIQRAIDEMQAAGVTLVKMGTNI